LSQVFTDLARQHLRALATELLFEATEKVRRRHQHKLLTLPGHPATFHAFGNDSGKAECGLLLSAGGGRHGVAASAAAIEGSARAVTGEIAFVATGFGEYQVFELGQGPLGGACGEDARAGAVSNHNPGLQHLTPP
jgi:hypothetical protein